MRFKLDENLPGEVADQLRSAGHDAMGVLDQRLGEESDQRIADVCRHEQRTLITLDLDFADIRAYPPEEHPGIIVLRPFRQDKAQILRVVSNLIPLLSIEPLDGHL